MEFVGFKQCMEYLIGYGLFIIIFIFDRYVLIVSYMKKVLKNIVYYFDIWYLKKSKFIYRYKILYKQGFRYIFGFSLYLFLK